MNTCKITESSEYNELKTYSPFSKQFEQYFSQDKLAGYDAGKLDEIVNVIPKIIPLIEQINNAITYGNALELGSGKRLEEFWDSLKKKPRLPWTDC